MASSIHIDASNMLSQFAEIESRAPIAMRMYAETGAQKLQGSARVNAPWTDRTGHARQRLTGSVEGVSEGFMITLAHGVEYGIWLEIANEKKYAIIMPTIQKEGPKIVSGFKRLLERL